MKISEMLKQCIKRMEKMTEEEFKEIKANKNISDSDYNENLGSDNY